MKEIVYAIVCIVLTAISLSISVFLYFVKKSEDNPAFRLDYKYFLRRVSV